MAAKQPYRILIADDHAVVRRGLRALLTVTAGIEVCSEAASGSRGPGLREEREARSDGAGPYHARNERLGGRAGGSRGVARPRIFWCSRCTSRRISRARFCAAARSVTSSSPMPIRNCSPRWTTPGTASPSSPANWPFRCAESFMQHTRRAGSPDGTQGAGRHSIDRPRDPSDSTAGGWEKQQTGGGHPGRVNAYRREPPQPHHAQNGFTSFSDLIRFAVRATNLIRAVGLSRGPADRGRHAAKNLCIRFRSRACSHRAPATFAIQERSFGCVPRPQKPRERQRARDFAQDDGARGCSCSAGFQPAVCVSVAARRNAAVMAALQEMRGGWRYRQPSVCAGHIYLPQARLTGDWGPFCCAPTRTHLC